MNDALLKTDLPLEGRRQGKVRDIYQCKTTAGEPALLIVASDRVSAFDVVMANGIPGKGAVLTQISTFWFDMIKKHFGDKLDHHLISTDPADVAGLTPEQIEPLKGRVMIGRRCNVVPIECVVRGYITGSGWKEYQKTRSVCGIKLPAGLNQCDKLPEPIFTPATKEDEGHDENISFQRACGLVGEPLMTRLKALSIDIYNMAHDYAKQRGIILADTKFEFGLPLDGGDEPVLIDEALTPDSSRFWPADQYEPGHDQPSFDKQIVRNFLQGIVDEGKWDKTPPGPELPSEVVNNTLKKYIQAYRELTGSEPNL